MEHFLPQLPYAQDALAPHISRETMTWLVKKADGSVDIANTSGAGTPLTANNFL